MTVELCHEPHFTKPTACNIAGLDCARYVVKFLTAALDSCNQSPT
jgi:hypothetical protein